MTEQQSTAEMSYTSGPTDVELLRQTLAQNLDEITAAHPDRAALLESTTGRSWTFAQLQEDSRTVA